MVGLFLFEFVEGNTVTRRQFQRTLRRSRAALETGQLSVLDRAEARTTLGRFTHFLDLPLFLVIVYCGAMRPDTWAHVVAAIAVALVATMVLTQPCRASPGRARASPAFVCPPTAISHDHERRPVISTDPSPCSAPRHDHGHESSGQP
jgi:hypothetical protein